MTEIEAIKQQLERNKEFAVVEVIEQLEKENEELSKALEESEQREKELCMLADSLQGRLKAVQKICFDSCLK